MTSERAIEAMRDARRRTLAMVSDLPDALLSVSKLEVVNPFLWELGHVAYFYDAVVRGYVDGAEPLLPDAAKIYDSFEIDHDDRWSLPLPDRATTLDYLELVAADLEREGADRAEDRRWNDCRWLAILHEDMHGEAFLHMRQALGYPAPRGFAPPTEESGPWPGDVDVPGGRFLLGSDPEREEFVFDNEKWAHPVDVSAFRIARAPVTNAEFQAFVEDGGYQQKELWTHSGWVWKLKNQVLAPEYWIQVEGVWQQSVFDTTAPLHPHRPVTHVSWHEANAFCAWSGRRLPTEAEWEMAASLDPATGAKHRYPWGEDANGEALSSRANLDGRHLGCLDVAALPAGDSPVGCRQMLGNVWEWTASAFYPYPGFVVDLPYREYSAPWFGDRQVLRGGAFPTRSRLVHNTYRNFFPPHYRAVFAGFRTCAR